LAAARDFWTLRYTTTLEDGSLVVSLSGFVFLFIFFLNFRSLWYKAFTFLNFVQICERSLTSSTGGPTGPPPSSFIRAEMLPSGYLIRPCEGSGSIIHIVDHVDLDVRIWSISSFQVLPELIFDLFTLCINLKYLFVMLGLECSWSSEATLWIIQNSCSENDHGGNASSWLWPYFFDSVKYVSCWFCNLILQALRHIRQIAQETSGEIQYGGGRQPAVLRTFSQRLCR